MEIWTLEHPTKGALRVAVGWPTELHDIDPGYPEGDGPSPLAQVRAARRAAQGAGDAGGVDLGKGASRAEVVAPGTDTRTDEGERAALADPAWKRRAKRTLNRNASWKRQGLVILRGDEAVARLRSIKDAKIRLAGTAGDGEFIDNVSTTAKPRLELSVDPLGRHVNDVLLRTDDEVLAFEPPTGSPGATRHAAMNASPWKRLVYPILGGLGKGGWALFALVVMPLVTKAIGAFVAWILSFFPPIHLPSIPWPSIHWPRIDLPDIPWPSIELPHVPWPHVDLPPWLDWLLEHPKIWTPVLLAVFWGMRASRSHKKSEAKKAEWAKRDAYARLDVAMRELQARRASEKDDVAAR